MWTAASSSNGPHRNVGEHRVLRVVGGLLVAQLVRVPELVLLFSSAKAVDSLNKILRGSDFG